MTAKWHISRRTLLRGVGASVALPLLDAMLPGGLAEAATALPAAAGKAGARAVIPTRMAFVFIPNGVNVNEWFPKEKSSGALELTPTLQPLKSVKDQVSFLTGLTLDGAMAHGDGAGDHARSAAAFLTGAHPYKTSGKDIHLGVSVDQFAAQRIGDHTRFPSLELGLDKTQTVGNCDSGYSCAYVSNIAWRSDTSPVPKEVDPGSAFDRLFGPQNGPASGPEVSLKRLKERKSVLDYVLDDTRRLNAKLGKSDQMKLDEFTTSIREVEKRVEAARAENAVAVKPDMPRPDGIPEKLSEHMDLMYDMMALAFRMDVTRIGTYMIARDGSNRSFSELDISEGHHSLSHHGHAPEKLAALKKIDYFHMQHFARFLEKLQDTKEGSGTLLDHSMIMLGSGISDGDRHNHNNLPVLLAGRGSGVIKPGRSIKYADGTPLCNLYLSMLEGMGVKAERFGDSSGTLKGLA
jgi:hypothetical protein